MAQMTQTKQTDLSMHMIAQVVSSQQNNTLGERHGHQVPKDRSSEVAEHGEGLSHSSCIEVPEQPTHVEQPDRVEQPQQPGQSKQDKQFQRIEQFKQKEWAQHAERQHGITRAEWEKNRTFDLGSIMDYWQMHKKESFEEAMQFFLQKVDPKICHLESPNEDIVRLTHLLFAEWFTFDYIAADGRTPFELYTHFVPEEDINEELAQQLQEIADTQFFSQFWVINQNPKDATTLLCDSHNGRFYVLLDELVARTPLWKDGLLGIRLARVCGVWIQVGAVPLHDIGPTKPKLEDLLVNNTGRLWETTCEVQGLTDFSVSDDPAKNKHVYYLGLIQELVGNNGAYIHGLRNIDFEAESDFDTHGF